MAAIKTRKNDKNVAAFLKGIAHTTRREDALVLLSLFEKATGEKAEMWGDSIIGFGDFHYIYESGREGDWFVAGFSPRKSSLSLYLPETYKSFDHLLKQLGKYRTGASCLYINKLSDVDLEILESLVGQSVAKLR
jgi:hypothetical protein